MAEFFSLYSLRLSGGVHFVLESKIFFMVFLKYSASSFIDSGGDTDFCVSGASIFFTEADDSAGLRLPENKAKKNYMTSMTTTNWDYRF